MASSSFFADNATVYTETSPPAPADAPVTTAVGQPSSFFGGTGQPYIDAATATATLEQVQTYTSEAQVAAAAAQAAQTGSVRFDIAQTITTLQKTQAQGNLGLGDAATKNTGTAAGTLAAGDDSRITGAAQKANNLSDLPTPATARTNLGLGGAATLSVGAAAGTVAAGDDSRITGAAQKANNLSDLAAPATARTNLGLGGAATLNVGAAAGTVAAGDDSRITGAAQKANNLSDLPTPATARTNLGLGDAATLNVGAAAGTVAAGDDSRITGAAQKASNLSDVASIPSARANLGVTAWVSGVSQLAGLDTTKDKVVYVTGISLPGWFVWTTGNFSTQVGNDSTSGWYIASAGTASSAGAWVRMNVPFNQGLYFSAAWGVASSSTDNIAALNYAQLAVQAFGGGTLLHPAGTMLLGVAGSGTVPSGVSAVVLRSTVNHRGVRGSTVFKLNSGVQKALDTFTGYISTGGLLTITSGTISRTYNSTSGAHADQIVAGRDASSVALSPGLYIQGLAGTGIYQLCTSTGVAITSTTAFGSSGSPVAMCTVPDALMYSGFQDDGSSTYDNLTLEDFTIDMNAANNTASNGVGIWGSAFALAIQRGAGIRIRNVSGINHGGSNTFYFGRNVDIASWLSTNAVTTLHGQTLVDFIAEGLYATNNGDMVNPACLDHSTAWLTVYGGGIFHSTFLNGFAAGAARLCTAIEVHGYRAAADENFIYGYAAGINLANERNGNLTSEGLSARGNKMELVNYGVVVWNVAGGGNTTGATVSECYIKLDPSSGIRGIDAQGEVDPANTGKASLLKITKNTIRCVWAGSAAALVIGIALGKWDSVELQGNYVHGMNGPALWADGNAYTTAVWKISGEIYKDCGVTTYSASTQYHSYIFLQSVTTLQVLEIDGVTLSGSGTTTYGITGGMAATKGIIAITFGSGITTPSSNYTGGVPLVLDTFSGSPTASFAGFRGRVTHM